MSPQKRYQLKLLQQSLHKDSLGLYYRVLHSLLQEHQEFPFASHLLQLLRKRDMKGFFDLADSLSTQKYVDAAEHFAANQFTLLIKKFPWPPSVLDLKPRSAAVKSFQASEKRCRRINAKFRFLYWNASRDAFSSEAGKARYWIRSLIGSFPNFKGIFSKADFGPGASIGVHGNATSYSAKILADRWTVSPGAFTAGYAAIRRNYHLWESLLPRRGPYVCYDEDYAFKAYIQKVLVVEENKICFVPKTAKTDRTIAVEPLLNGLVQKGIDMELRKKLLSVGIDLSDQGLNQRLAREGSTNDSDDGFVTIDLKSASDSVSIEVVRHLLPYDWYRLLDNTRSKRYVSDEDSVSGVFEKFCSMGNGFCFPLETLIFSSACIAVGCGVPSQDFIVYGDDIVVRKRYAAPLIAFLKHLGFKINTDKTFLEGPFRESCGTDWFGGKDVRPFTLDYALDSLQNIFKYLNLTRRSEICEDFFRATRPLLLKQLPRQYQFFRPFEGQEDSGIDSTGDEFLTAPSCNFSPRKNRWEWEELSISPCIDFDSMERSKDQPWLMGVALRGTPSVNFGLHEGLPKVTLRNKTQTKIVRKGYVSTSNWLPPLTGI